MHVKPSLLVCPGPVVPSLSCPGASLLGPHLSSFQFQLLSLGCSPAKRPFLELFLSNK